SSLPSTSNEPGSIPTSSSPTASIPTVSNPTASVSSPTASVPTQPVICSGNLGPEPAITTCTNCRQRVTTNVVYKAGAFAWLICLAFILFGFVFGCCLIPFFMDAFQDAHHSCPQCNASLHVHKRL
uniref:LITAF domain-containing protein n=1 Tax=Paramormyrops kingsleyae TaxID=1676925 RepID=A0A3B3SPK3_9TELE